MSIPVDVNRKRIIQKFGSILNFLHPLTSSLFNKKNSGVAGSLIPVPRHYFQILKITYLPKSLRNQKAYSEPCQASKIKHFANRSNG